MKLYTQKAKYYRNLAANVFEMQPTCHAILVLYQILVNTAVHGNVPGSEGKEDLERTGFQIFVTGLLSVPAQKTVRVG